MRVTAWKQNPHETPMKREDTNRGGVERKVAISVLCAKGKKVGPEGPQEHTQYVSEHIRVNKAFPNESLPREFCQQNPNESASPQVGEKGRIPRKTKQTNLCSLTGVNPPRTHGFGVWGGKRVVVGVRIDEKLYEAFKPVAKLVFGSVCRPVEAFMAAVVASNQAQQLTSKLGVNPSPTVEIGRLVIERNVRTRRKLVVEETNEEVVEKVVAKPKPEREPVDYSKLSLEELQALYDKYTRWGPHKHLGPYSMVMGELKRRGIAP